MPDSSPVAAAAALSASLEDYLETIYCVVEEQQVARPKDIVQATGVHNSSVTGALRLLARQGLIHYAPYGLVTLTDAGRRAARDIRARHQALLTFFAEILGVAEADAERGACGMEHTIPRAVLDRLVRFIEFLHQMPDDKTGLLTRFRAFCATAETAAAAPPGPAAAPRRKGRDTAKAAAEGASR
jgi:DtxR family Mn-dependent transcriptional regulator